VGLRHKTTLYKQSLLPKYWVQIIENSNKMSKPELTKKQQQFVDPRGRVDVQRILLSTIATAGVISVAVLAPNALQIVKLFKNKNGRYRNSKYINSTLAKLEDKGMISFEKVKDQEVARLTEKGQNELLKYQLKKKGLRKNLWDKKWRVVIFDIKEAQRHTRDKVRYELEGLGFVKLQNSVWINPYPCEDVVAMLKADARIGKDVLYMKVEHIENDHWLRKQFGLA
jgi:DNA-binding PadR family transcriptional regulator